MGDYDRTAGTRLNKTFLEDPERPVDELLRWHFRQAVLANVRGQGEPYFDPNDMIDEAIQWSEGC